MNMCLFFSWPLVVSLCSLMFTWGRGDGYRYSDLIEKLLDEEARSMIENCESFVKVALHA